MIGDVELRDPGVKPGVMRLSSMVLIDSSSILIPDVALEPSPFLIFASFLDFVTLDFVVEVDVRLRRVGSTPSIASRNRAYLILAAWPLEISSTSTESLATSFQSISFKFFCFKIAKRKRAIGLSLLVDMLMADVVGSTSSLS